MRLSQETQAAPSNALEGTLAYLSPEQTGRTNRVVDHRTDFYSLGVTLYEMLTGVVPFQSSDAMELVHHHIALTAVPPAQLRSEIPAQVSALVMKLLAKNPEERYQHARGLIADLKECLQQLEQHGTVAPFVLGAHDTSSTLRFPQRLYGRERQVAELLAALRRVQAGRPELVLVTGPAGMGKSSLVHDLEPEIVQRGGQLVSGKFEQRHRSLPFAAFTQAFRELCRRLLMQSAARLELQRTALLQAVGVNGRLLTDLIPELELIIGPQPAVAPLGPTESQNRFGGVVQAFMRAFCSAEHPLLMLLEDLQWADSASLWLLRMLMSDEERGYLLLVATYRSEDVDAAHPVFGALDGLRKQGRTVAEITVGPLDLGSIRQYLCDLLRQPISPELEALARQIEAKTHGNPFFLSQFLLTLHASKILRMDADSGEWRWDATAIEAAPITDNVAEFMSRQIQRLAPQSQQLLAAAACIGYYFDLETLAALAGSSAAATYPALLPAISGGLVLPLAPDYVPPSEADGAEGAPPDPALSASFRFLHDRVQQAAYQQLDPTERQHLHLGTGRLLRDKLARETHPQTLFDAVHHLNAGAAGITDRAERIDLVRLNLQAARLAKSATAFAAAIDLLEVASAQLGPDGWETEYELAYELYHELIECEYFDGHFARAEARIEPMLSHMRTDLQRASVLRLRMMIYTSQGQFQQALFAGQQGLKFLGIELPQTAPQCQEAFMGEVMAIEQRISSTTIAALLESPPMADPEQLTISGLLSDMALSAYQVAPPLAAFLIARGVRLALTYGHSSSSAQSYVTYGLLLAGLLGRYADALALGRLALQLVERTEAHQMAGKVNLMFGIYSSYCEPLRAALGYFTQAQQAGLAAGDLVYASLGFCYYPHTQFCLGDNLEATQIEIERGLQAMKRTQDGMSLAVLTLLRQVAECLQGRTKGPTTLNSDGFTEAEWLARCEAMSFHSGPCIYGTFKLQIHYLHEEYEAALQMAELAERTIASSLGMHWTTDIPFYAALSLAALRLGTGGQLPPPAEEALARALGLLERLAASSPANERHRHLLVRAELARGSQEPATALSLYEQAITAARENGFLHHEALANELCARFHLAHGRTRVAAAYLAEARYGYERWGAGAKVTQLNKKYRRIIDQPEMPLAMRAQLDKTTDTVTTLWMPGQQLDVASVMRAAQALSSEIVLDKVLAQVMRVILASAGAQRGLLVLQRDGSLWVEATIALNPEQIEVNLHAPLEARTDLAVSVVRYVGRTRETVVISNAQADARFASDPYIAARQPKSILGLPLINQGRLCGVMYLENNVISNAFTGERVELLQMLSVQAAISVENALLYSSLKDATEQLQKVNESLEQQVAQRTEQLSRALSDLWSEMDLARKIQTVLLPTHPQMPGYELSAVMRPAANVGGDYYDLVHADGSHWLLIGDVSGHGVSAGLCMMMVQTAIRAVVETLQSAKSQLRPAQILALANAALHSNLSQIGREQYMTITALCFDGGTVRYAGLHQDILIYRAATRKVEQIETQGVWLGLKADISGLLPEDELKVEPGDILLLFTDGITEARLDKRRFLYTAGLLRLFEEAVRLDPTPATIVERILDHLKPYTIKDDMTLIAVKRTTESANG